MESLFPNVLFLTDAGLFLLRVATGIVFLTWGYALLEPARRRMLAEELQVFGGYANLAVWLLALIEVGIGLLFVAGFLTQLAALIGLLLSVKFFFLRHKYPSLSSESGLLYLLLIAVCIHLFVSGAGLWAVDIPF